MLTTGTILDARYLIQRELGVGGMGVVYLARDQRLQRAAVVKVLAPHLARNQIVRRRFVTEALIQGGIDHPNIVRATDLIESDELLAIVMDFVDGPSLEQHLAEMSGRLTWARARTVLLPVMEAVHAAHEQGVVHRDLKPANILLDRVRGIEVPKVADFGIAKLLAEDAGHTRQGTVIGTPNYMPPEQLEGSADLDPRADVYALGAIILELLTGRCPYFGDTEYTIARRVFAGEPPHFEDLRAVGAPIGLEPLLRRAMAPDRANRIHSVAELRDAIRALGGDTETRRPPPPPTVIEAAANSEAKGPAREVFGTCQ